MCFSPQASFISGAVLTVIGISTIKKAQTSAQIIFATIPFIFAIQQITEGFIWLSLLHTYFAPWHHFSTYLFLIFAQIIWPTWIPLSIFLLENNKRNKNILYLLLGIGILLSIVLCIRLLIQNVSSEVVGYHIKYNFSASSSIFEFTGLFYVIVAVIPPFISSINKMKFLGGMSAISLLITKLFYEDFIISVWCYFAALMSIIIYYIMMGFSPSIPIDDLTVTNSIKK